MKTQNAFYRMFCWTEGRVEEATFREIMTEKSSELKKDTSSEIEKMCWVLGKVNTNEFTPGQSNHSVTAEHQRRRKILKASREKSRLHSTYQWSWPASRYPGAMQAHLHISSLTATDSNWAPIVCQALCSAKIFCLCFVHFTVLPGLAQVTCLPPGSPPDYTSSQCCPCSHCHHCSPPPAIWSLPSLASVACVFFVYAHK